MRHICVPTEGRTKFSPAADAVPSSDYPSPILSLTHICAYIQGTGPLTCMRVHSKHQTTHVHARTFKAPDHSRACAGVRRATARLLRVCTGKMPKRSPKSLRRTKRPRFSACSTTCDGRAGPGCVPVYVCAQIVAYAVSGQVPSTFV